MTMIGVVATGWLLLTVAVACTSAGTLSDCTYHPGRDYGDPAVPGTEQGLNATSQAACCALCVADSRCAAAAYAKPSSKAGAGTGRCYLKVSAAIPIEKGASGPIGCATHRAAPPGPAPADDDMYDCRFRHLAMEFASSIVLRSWTSSRAADALRDIANGLRIGQCNATQVAPPSESRTVRDNGVEESLELFVAPDGDDSAAGTLKSPLRSIGGAQARIRQAHPDVASRPAIRVTLLAGDYFVPARARDSAFVPATVFGSADSGRSASAPIIYAAEMDSSTGFAKRVTLHGGVLLSERKLVWNTGPTPGSFVTTLPTDVHVDMQDQLFLDGRPLVRARLPNGRPWLPLDGFNLTAGFATPEIKQRQLPHIPKVVATCAEKVHVDPPAPHSGPSPKAPPYPALGACSLPEPGISLLSGSGLGAPDFQMIGKLQNSSACEAACLAQPCCSGFTWHDQHQAQWSHDCYLVTNPLNIWSRAQKSSPGHVSGLCNHGPNRLPCSGETGAKCVDTGVDCAATKETMVRGPVPPHSFAVDAENFSSKTNTITVPGCYAHLPDMGNSWPEWKAVGYGLLGDDRLEAVEPFNTVTDNDSGIVNSLTFDQNFPLWQGPWASGLVVDSKQDAGNAGGLKSLRWSDAAQGRMVVHSMADGEWGGVQFLVNNASKLPNGDSILNFSAGGWQQARSAELTAGGGFGAIGNRYYIEGSIDFLDQTGEWHFDPLTRSLSIIPPVGLGKIALETLPLILTQTDSLLRFAGSGNASDQAGGRVQHVHIVNLTLSHTSAQFFRPHEETSGGDYAVCRFAAVFVENSSSLVLQGNDMLHIGGNAVFLSNSVSNVTVLQNRLSFVGTSGVSIVGRTGASMMDARDGEAMVAAGGKDNGVRLPKHNVVSENVISDYGVWGKQSAAFHKALAPGNVFSKNVVFNSSRHGVNFQDSMGGMGLVAHNVFFNLNRETKDTASLNSWGRRNYLFSNDLDPLQPQLVPSSEHLNRWRNNLVLARNYWGVRDGNGNCLRCDDGASWFNMSNNICYTPKAAGDYSGMEFNGGSQVYTHGNLFVHGGWTLCAAPPGEGGGSHDTYIDSPFMWRGICGNDKCLPLWESNNATHQTSPGMCKNLTHGCKPAILISDFNTLVFNSTGQDNKALDLSGAFCGMNLSTWRQRTHADIHTELVLGGEQQRSWSPDAVLVRARQMLFGEAERATRPL